MAITTRSRVGQQNEDEEASLTSPVPQGLPTGEVGASRPAMQATQTVPLAEFESLRRQSEETARALREMTSLLRGIIPGFTLGTTAVAPPAVMPVRNAEILVSEENEGRIERNREVNARGVDMLLGTASMPSIARAGVIANLYGAAGIHGVAGAGGVADLNGTAVLNGVAFATGITNDYDVAGGSGVANLHGAAGVAGVASMHGTAGRIDTAGQHDDNVFRSMLGLRGAAGVEDVRGAAGVEDVRGTAE